METVSYIIRQVVLRYAEQNVAMVNIFFRVPFAEKIVTDEKISRISFMSDIGGLMGLFMGFSFVSAVEIVYHVFGVSPVVYLMLVVEPNLGHKKTKNP